MNQINLYIINGLSADQETQCASLETVLNHHKLYILLHQDDRHTTVPVMWDRVSLLGDVLYMPSVLLVLLLYAVLIVERLLGHSKDPHPSECVGRCRSLLCIELIYLFYLGVQSPLPSSDRTINSVNFSIFSAETELG